MAKRRLGKVEKTGERFKVTKGWQRRVEKTQRENSRNEADQISGGEPRRKRYAQIAAAGGENQTRLAVCTMRSCKSFEDLGSFNNNCKSVSLGN